MHSMELSAKPCARHWIWGDGVGDADTWMETEHSGVATAGGPAGTCVLSPYLGVQEKRQRGGSQRVQAAEPDCTLLKPEGFMRALAITTTICCAGERQILFLFVSSSEAREADFSTRGHTIVGAEEKNLAAGQSCSVSS